MGLNQLVFPEPHRMQLKTILNHVEPHKSFVYKKVRWSDPKTKTAIEILIEPRANGHAICSGCDGRAPDSIWQRMRVTSVTGLPFVSSSLDCTDSKSSILLDSTLAAVLALHRSPPSGPRLDAERQMTFQDERGRKQTRKQLKKRCRRSRDFARTRRKPRNIEYRTRRAEVKSA